MTEQEKQEAIATLQAQVNGSVSYLLALHDIAEKQGTLELFNVFKDPTVETMIRQYRELHNLRGY
jgi:hypothetical protein